MKNITHRETKRAITGTALCFTPPRSVMTHDLVGSMYPEERNKKPTTIVSCSDTIFWHYSHLISNKHNFYMRTDLLE